MIYHKVKYPSSTISIFLCNKYDINKLPIETHDFQAACHLVESTSPGVSSPVTTISWKDLRAAKLTSLVEASDSFSMCSSRSRQALGKSPRAANSCRFVTNTLATPDIVNTLIILTY